MRWEFLVQRSVGLRILCIEDVDLGSGPLEWLCKGLRSHQVRCRHAMSHQAEKESKVFVTLGVAPHVG